ncbi:MAG: inner membrane CreD family protein [Bacteroidales bacterium]
MLSLSEHIVFGFAYLIASAGIILLIAAYSRAIFKNNATSLTMASFLVLVYGVLFILLQMQDHVLLLGSLFLFIALAVAMYISMKIDWER